MKAAFIEQHGGPEVLKYGDGYIDNLRSNTGRHNFIRVIR